ncbi:sensor histidine kinase [Daejeonella oryzae]|uniref:sensor histidine kinase n=1 Tax=Daejeonella oryzae TaxID=1122943 RepID=UPI0003F735D1|nr:PAS domain-containing sensor histidine kinase [Daejeonella oryzae]
MGDLNKLLSDQIKDFSIEQSSLPDDFLRLLSKISSTYDTFEKDQLQKETLVSDLENQKLNLESRLQKESEELKLTKNELNRIFHVVSEGFYSRDLINNRYNYLSAGCQKIYGYSIEDFKNNVNLWFEVIHPDDRYIIDRDNERLLTGESINSEYRIILKDKNIRWIEVSVVPVFTDSKLTQVDGIIKNITERKLAEQKLEDQNKELVKTNSELDRFVYSASHELRSPLTSIMGLVTLAKLQDTEAEKNKCINLIESCVASLDGLIKDIIEYSKNSRVDIEHDEISFSNLLEEIKKPLSYSIETENLNIQLDIEQQGIFYSDRKRIAVVLNNLISNAIKYYDPDKAERFIHIRIKTGTDEAKIEIIDNGLGIPEDKLNKIFQMFYRANSSITGSGLGLYIVKEILDRIGGTVTAESEFGKGSAFSLIIPNTKAG